jgi:hypothetical protein
LDTYNILEAIPHTGKEISVDIGIRGQSTLWSVKGVLQSKDISINFGEKVVSTLNIEENGYGSEPTVTNRSPNPVNASSFIQLQGTNLDQTTAVYFSNGIRTNEIKNRTSTSIDVLVPRFAKTGPVKVVTPYGEVDAGSITVNGSIDIP